MNSINYVVKSTEPEFETYEEYSRDINATSEERIASVSFYDLNSSLIAFKGEQIQISEKKFNIYPFGKSNVCDNLRRMLTKVVVVYDTKPWKIAGLECARHFKNIDIFKKIKCFKNSYNISCHSYSLDQYSIQLKNISKISINEIKLQAEAYGINFIVNEYFENVANPEEGDLVVYWDDQNPRSSGIYKTEQVVESLWNAGFSGHYVFQHALFFVPTEFGNEVKFYRPKSPRAQPDDIHLFNEDSIPLNLGFKCLQNKEKDAIRQKIENLKEENLIKEFPEIHCKKEVNFLGYCYGYALGKILKTYSAPKNFLYMMPSQTYLDSLFNSILQPQTGDLAVYYEHEEGKILHFGVYTEDHRIESKWGKDSVYLHPPFLVPASYGEFIRYYRIKESTSQQI